MYMSEEPSSKRIFVPEAVIKSAGIITAPRLGDRILSGERGYMNRGVWPLEVMMNGEKVTGSAEMRKDYVDIPDLANPLLERSDETSFLIWRTNIPMNPGAGWYENNQWYLHPDDRISLDRIVEVPLIDISPTGNIRARVIEDDGEIPAGHYAVLTPCLGQNSFDAALAMACTYDSRHFVNMQYVMPEDGKSFDEVRDHPNNQTLVRLAGLFLHDEDKYNEEILEIVYANPGKTDWSTYTRTLMVVGNKGIEFYSFKGTAPPGIMEAIQQETESNDFSVFGLVEGGSFSLGLVSDRKVFEVGIREPRNYHRPPQGMWLGWMEIDKAYENEIMEVGVKELPSNHS